MEEQLAGHGEAFEVGLAAPDHAVAEARVPGVQAALEGMYRVILSDNPWIYSDRPPSGSGAQQRYPGMTIEQQCRRGLPCGEVDQDIG